MTASTARFVGRAMASTLALGFILQTGAALAQAPGYYPQPQGQYGPPQGQYGPPQGQYGPPTGQGYPAQQGYGYQGQGMGPPPGQYAPPPGADQQVYDDQSQAQDQAYSAAYGQWAAQYCVDQHNNNVAAGAVIGGVLGALMGAGVAGHHDQAAGAFAGGALGATAGAAIGSSASSNCPPGYVVTAGAPAFAYAGYALAAAPAWYNPWVYSGGHWAYTPYRRWYYGHPGYWGHGQAGRRARYPGYPYANHNHNH